MTTLSLWYLFIIVKQGTYSSQCRGWDMRQVQCRGEPFPKPALSILDPDCSIPGLFGALFRGYFSLPKSGHLWDWLLHWLFHYCHTPFCPLKTGITQTRRFHPKTTCLPFLIFPCADVRKGHSRHRQSLGIALQRLQLWDRAVLS